MTLEATGYAYIWEYTVRPKCVTAFEDAYRPGGVWVELFRTAPGYLRTELHRDRHDATRYVTIDYWESAEAWDSFRESMAAEFEAIDAQCEHYTLQEREIGVFLPVGS